MNRSGMRGWIAAVGAFAWAILPSQAWPAQDAPNGELLYEQFCAACHDSGRERIPSRVSLATHTNENIVLTLEYGVMRRHCSSCRYQISQAGETLTVQGLQSTACAPKTLMQKFA